MSEVTRPDVSFTIPPRPTDKIPRDRSLPLWGVTFVSFDCRQPGYRRTFSSWVVTTCVSTCQRGKGEIGPVPLTSSVLIYDETPTSHFWSFLEKQNLGTGIIYKYITVSKPTQEFTGLIHLTGPGGYSLSEGDRSFRVIHWFINS